MKLSLMVSLWLHHFLTLSKLWKKKRIAEEEGGSPVFDIDVH